MTTIKKSVATISQEVTKLATLPMALLPSASWDAKVRAGCNLPAIVRETFPNYLYLRN